MQTWNTRARSARPAGNCSWNGWTASSPGRTWRNAIRPFYPKPGRGLHPYSLSAMLRVHCVQLFYNLSDPGMEDLLYESDPVRRFVGLKLSDPLPDETTILNFNLLLERHSLGQGLLEEINAHLESQGLRLREGTIVDATIIEAPSSTKNQARERGPEMHQTKKGSQWHFGMKAHIGVDSETGIVHSMSATAANVHDVTQAHKLLHGGEMVVLGGRSVPGRSQAGGESGPGGGMAGGDAAGETPEAGTRECGATGGKGEGVGKVQGGASLPEDEAAVRALQAALPGLAKNAERLALLFGLGNLLTAEGQLRR